MKTITLGRLLALLPLVLGSGQALAETTTFTNAAGMSLAASAAPTPAAPYPSAINVSGMSGLVHKVTVQLTGLTHTYPDDLDLPVAELHHPRRLGRYRRGFRRQRESRKLSPCRRRRPAAAVLPAPRRAVTRGPDFPRRSLARGSRAAAAPRIDSFPALLEAAGQAILAG